MTLCCLKGCKTTRTFHTTRVLAFFCFKWQRQRTTICWCRKTSKGIAATRPGRRLRHFNSRSFFRQNSAQTFAKWIKPAVKMLFCLRRQHRRRGTPSPFWSLKSILNHRVWSSETEKFCWGQPESRELSSETEKLFQIPLFENIAPGTPPPLVLNEHLNLLHIVIWDRNIVPTSVVWGRRYCLLTQNFSLTIIAWGRQYCHLRQKTTH